MSSAVDNNRGVGARPGFRSDRTSWRRSAAGALAFGLVAALSALVPGGLATAATPDHGPAAAGGPVPAGIRPAYARGATTKAPAAHGASIAQVVADATAAAARRGVRTTARQVAAIESAAHRVSTSARAQAATQASTESPGDAAHGPGLRSQEVGHTPPALSGGVVAIVGLDNETFNIYDEPNVTVGTGTDPGDGVADEVTQSSDGSGDSLTIGIDTPNGSKVTPGTDFTPPFGDTLLTVSSPQLPGGSCVAGQTSGAVEVIDATYGAGAAPQSLAYLYVLFCNAANTSEVLVGTMAFDLAAMPGAGYSITESDGLIDGGFGNEAYLEFLGALTQNPMNAPAVGSAVTADGGGYWLAGSDGGIFTYGDAHYYGSHGGSPLNAPIVGIAASPDDHGYWLVASDGGIFTYGDAHFYGSHGGSHLNAPIVGMASTPDGHGYWLVASDGGIFSYGDARFHGSHGGSHLNAPITGMGATSDGGGYWLVASDGGIFTYGDAHFYGSHGGKPLNAPIAAMASTPDGGGYWLLGQDGGIFSYGDAHYYGSLVQTFSGGEVGGGGGFVIVTSGVDDAVSLAT